MLLEIALADSYAIPFEFVKNPKEHGLVNDLTSYQQNPRYPELRPSQYTDDTLRSIATADVIEHVLLDPSSYSAFDPCSYVEAIIAMVQHDYSLRNEYRKGWSKRFQEYLETNINATPLEFMRGITNRKNSNGSIMGCLPTAYLRNIVDVKLAASIQAITTHCSTTIPYAQAMALSAHYFLYNLGPASDLRAFLFEYVDGDVLINDRDDGPVKMTAEDTALAVISLIEEPASLSTILYNAVDLGGDTDSVAALAVGIASCSKEYENDLPSHLIEQLDEGKGASFLQRLDQSLEDCSNILSQEDGPRGSGFQRIGS